MSVFSAILAKTQLPEAALKPIEAKLVEAFDLIVENNKRVAQVNAAKANDPSRPGFEDELDKLWRLHAPSDETMSEIQTQFDAVAESYEKLQKQLREFAKTKIEAPLSEEETKKVKALVNESAPAIAKAKQSAADMAQVADTMLALPHINAPIEGGIISLLPEVESLKQMRGRKAASSGETGKAYMVRVVDVLLDGKSTNRIVNGESKGKLNYAADEMSKQFNEAAFPENKVSAEELETAYWEALELPWRSKKNTELPESFDFEFTKTIKVQNPNDDSTTDIPKTVKVTVKQPAKVVETPAAETPKADETKSETKADEKTDTPKTETKPANSKPETLKVSDHVKPEPAKTATPKAAK